MALRFDNNLNTRSGVKITQVGLLSRPKPEILSIYLELSFEDNGILRAFQSGRSASVNDALIPVVELTNDRFIKPPKQNGFAHTYGHLARPLEDTGERATTGEPPSTGVGNGSTLKYKGIQVGARSITGP